MEYKVRTYVEGDDVELVELFNRVYKKYTGFVPRTREYWIWCCYKRPDVENEGIIIIEEKQTRRIVGYTVLGKSGNVWELCVDPEAPKREILLIIFEEINGYFGKANSDRIVVNVPSDDYVMQEICEKMGLAEQAPSRMFIGIVDFKGLIEALGKKSCEKLGNFRETVTVGLLNARHWINPDFSIRIENDKLQILPYSTSNSITIKVDSDVFASIILGRVSPLMAFLGRKLEIRPLRKIFEVLKFLNSIQIHNLWFYPLADYG